MLSACRRILKPGGRTAFLTIEAAPGLSKADRRRANAAGPPGVAMPTSYVSILQSLRFEAITATDLTTEYRTTQRHWIDASLRHQDGLQAAMGDQAFEDRVTNRQVTLDAAEEGLLRRVLYTARRPG